MDITKRNMVVRVIVGLGVGFLTYKSFGQPPTSNTLAIVAILVCASVYALVSPKLWGRSKKV